MGWPFARSPVFEYIPTLPPVLALARLAPTTVKDRHMAQKMQTATVEQFGKPLVLREWDIPTPGPGSFLATRASASSWRSAPA